MFDDEDAAPTRTFALRECDRRTIGIALEVTALNLETFGYEGDLEAAGVLIRSLRLKILDDLAVDVVA